MARNSKSEQNSSVIETDATENLISNVIDSGDVTDESFNSLENEVTKESISEPVSESDAQVDSGYKESESIVKDPLIGVPQNSKKFRHLHYTK